MLLPLLERETSRRTYHVEGKSIRQISRETGHCRDAIRKAITDDPSQGKSFQYPKYRPAPIFSPFQAHIEEMLLQNDQLPRKQHYTAHRIFENLKAEGHQGAESRICQ